MVSIGYPVYIRKVGDKFELRVEALLLVVCEHDLSSAWANFKRRAGMAQRWIVNKV